MPREPNSEENKRKALEIINKTKEYIDTLADIVNSDNFELRIKKLKEASQESIRLRAHEVEKLFKDLRYMLLMSDLSLEELKGIVNLDHYGKEEANLWNGAYDKIVYAIHMEFCEEMGDLRKEFKVNIHTKEELEEIVKSKKHLAEILK